MNVPQLKQAMLVGLICLDIWLIYLAASWGVADLVAKQASYKMQQWEKQNIVKTDTWQTTIATLRVAQFFEPHHPDFLEEMGKANYWLFSYGTITAAEKFMALTQALDYYLKAAEQKPVSAETWAYIAILKYRLRQYDAQFLTALENATFLGPHEPFVQQAIADIGLAAWYRLPKQIVEKGRAIIFATVQRGMLRQAKLMTTLVKKHRREYVICVYGRKKNELIDFCP
jgi:hypothetical protein